MIFRQFYKLTLFKNPDKLPDSVKNITLRLLLQFA